MAETVKPYIDTDSWDGKYTSGDDLNYALGMMRARVLAKPKGTDTVYDGLEGGLKWTLTGTVDSKLQAWPDGSSIGLLDATGGTAASDELRVLGLSDSLFNDRVQGNKTYKNWLSTVKNGNGFIERIYVTPSDLGFWYQGGYDAADGFLMLTGKSYKDAQDAPDNIVGGSGANWNIEIPHATADVPGVIRTGYTTSGLNRKLNIDGNGNGYITQIDTKMSNKAYALGTDANVVVGTRITNNTTLADVTKTLTAGTWTGIVGSTSAITFNWTPGDVFFSSESYSLGQPSLSLIGESSVSGTTDNVIGNGGALWSIDLPFASYTPASGSTEAQYQPGIINLGHPGGSITQNSLSYLNLPLLTDNNHRAYVSLNEALFGGINAIINYGDTHQAELAGEGIINTDGTIDIQQNSTAIQGRSFIELKVPSSMFDSPLVMSTSSGKNTVGLMIGGKTSGTYVQSGLTVYKDQEGYENGLAVHLLSSSPLGFSEHGEITFNHDPYSLDVQPLSASDIPRLTINPSYFNKNSFIFTPTVANSAVTDEDLNIRIATTGSGANKALAIAEGNSETPVANTAQGLYVEDATANQAGVAKVANVRSSAITSTTGNTHGNYYGVEKDSVNKTFVAVPNSSTSGKGVVQLSNTYKNSSDQTTAPTSKALSDAYKNIMETIGGLEGVHFNIYSSETNLPDISTKDQYDLHKNIIGLVAISGASAPDAYAEYVAIKKTSGSTTTYVWEKIGDTNIDLSGYVQFTDNLGSANVTAIVRDVFGF